MQRLLVWGLLAFAVQVGHAWDGYDLESGSDVEIESGNLVRPGREVEYFDHGAGEYRYGDVESIRRYGSTVEVEIYDHDTGDVRILEMQD
jgi:hypothetical protein